MIVNEQDVEAAYKIPYWVKCMRCGERPTETDWLIEVIPNSTALIHQSCAGKQGKLPGMDGFGLKGE